MSTLRETMMKPLKHFPPKHALGRLIRGWIPVRRRKCDKRVESKAHPGSVCSKTDSTRSGCALMAALALAAAASFPSQAAAASESYPDRPIQVIVPFAGGSASDVVTRIMLERMSKSMGQPFVIDN